MADQFVMKFPPYNLRFAIFSRERVAANHNPQYLAEKSRISCYTGECHLSTVKFKPADNAEGISRLFTFSKLHIARRRDPWI